MVILRETLAKIIAIEDSALSPRLQWPLSLSAQLQKPSFLLWACVLGWLATLLAVLCICWARLPAKAFADISLAFSCVLASLLAIGSLGIAWTVRSFPSLSHLRGLSPLPFELATVIEVVGIFATLGQRWGPQYPKYISPVFIEDNTSLWLTSTAVFLSLEALLLLPLVFAFRRKDRHKQHQLIPLTWPIAQRYFSLPSHRSQLADFLRLEGQVEWALAVLSLVHQVEWALAVLSLVHVLEGKNAQASARFSQLFLEQGSHSCLLLPDLTPTQRAEAILALHGGPGKGNVAISGLAATICQHFSNSPLWGRYQLLTNPNFEDPETERGPRNTVEKGSLKNLHNNPDGSLKNLHNTLDELPTIEVDKVLSPSITEDDDDPSSDFASPSGMSKSSSFPPDKPESSPPKQHQRSGSMTTRTKSPSRKVDRMPFDEKSEIGDTLLVPTVPAGPKKRRGSYKVVDASPIKKDPEEDFVGAAQRARALSKPRSSEPLPAPPRAFGEPAGELHASLWLMRGSVNNQALMRAQATLSSLAPFRESALQALRRTQSPEAFRSHSPEGSPKLKLTRIRSPRASLSTMPPLPSLQGSTEEQRRSSGKGPGSPLTFELETGRSDPAGADTQDDAGPPRSSAIVHNGEGGGVTVAGGETAAGGIRDTSDQKTAYKDIHTGVIEAPTNADNNVPYVSLAIASQCGYVPEMLKPNQDRCGYAIMGDDASKLACCVFDGHGGAGHDVSAWLLDHLFDYIAQAFAFPQEASGGNKQQLETKALQQAVCTAFEKANTDLCNATSGVMCEYSGSTAVVVVLEGRTLLHSFNLGDSRAILGRRVVGKKDLFQAVSVTKDQKPGDPEEKARIVAAGGRVALQDPQEPEAGLRVWKKDENVPGLAVSRAFGDVVGQECGIIATPVACTIPLTPADEFVVLGSDGLWEFLPEGFVVDIVSEAEDASQACEQLISYAANMWFSHEGSSDDITVAVIFLPGRIAAPQRPDEYWHQYGEVVDSEE
eukprot:g14853.t1